MEFSLIALRKYGKKSAKKANNFKKFDLIKDRVIIDFAGFSELASSGVYFAQSKKDFRKALVSDFPFVYNKKKGLLFYNENGASKKFGKGGIVALFPKNLALTDRSFEAVNRGSSEPTPTPDPTPTTDAVFPHGPRPMEISSESFSGVIGKGGEVDRFSISASVGDVVSLSVDAAGVCKVVSGTRV